MTFLPIVARELRIAARRKTTFTIRTIVALLGIVIGGSQLLLMALIPQTGANGGIVFEVATGYAFLIALLGGIFLASDSLSQERRDGTLGFLFLTDLKSYDVVLGKFAAVSLNAFYGMLALLPVLAISLLAGGVTGAEFSRTCLALVNTLFFSVAAALWVSACCKSSYRSMVGAIALIIGVLALSAIGSVVSRFFSKLAPEVFLLQAISPFTAFQDASAASYYHQAAAYWSSLAICNALAWLFLGLASWQLRYWRDSEKADGGWRRIVGAIVASTERRRELLSINPILWLLDNSRRLQWAAWVLAVTGGVGALLSSANKSGIGIFANTYVTGPFYFLLKILFAIQACRFFSESRRNGALEMLYSTPLARTSIISGQWMSLRRIFLWPVIILIACQLACLCFLGSSLSAVMGSGSFTVSSNSVVIQSGTVGHGAIRTPPPLALIGWYPVFTVLKQIANSIADFFAIGWFGMWLALSLRKPAASTGLTILYVIILPTILLCIPTVATDAVFITIGYSKLQENFRTHLLAAPR